MGSNAAALHGVANPDDLPVLDFLSSDSIATIPNWLEKHESQLKNVSHHEIVEFEGPHYLHWTQSKAMADKITDFLQEGATSQGRDAGATSPSAGVPAVSHEYSLRKR